MRLLLILLLHPTHIIRNRTQVPFILINLSVVGFACIIGMAFQYLYPRLLNSVPWLGFLRKFSIANWSPAFNLEYFLRGSAMGFWIVIVLLLVFLPLHLANRVGGNPLQVCYLASLASSIPMVIACAIGFLFYYIHLSVGLFPMYGFVATTCLQATLMRELFRVPRAIVIYLAPLVMALQIYGCYLLLP